MSSFGARIVGRGLIAAIAFAACGPGEETVEDERPAEESTGGAAPGAAAAPGAEAARPGGEEGGPGEPASSAIPDPSAPEMNRTAPATFDVRFGTSEGDFVVRVHRDWAPHGADRFFNLVEAGFFDGARFFRVLEGFVAQFGIPADPRVAAQWRTATLPPDPVVESNTRGRLTYAMGGSPDTRSTQLFINYADNSRLDGMGFAPIGEVVEGMEVVDRLYAGYGEGAPSGRGPSQPLLQQQGNAYLERDFPELDYIESTEVIDREG